MLQAQWYKGLEDVTNGIVLAILPVVLQSQGERPTLCVKTAVYVTGKA